MILYFHFIINHRHQVYSVFFILLPPRQITFGTIIVPIHLNTYIIFLLYNIKYKLYKLGVDMRCSAPTGYVSRQPLA